MCERQVVGQKEPDGSGIQHTNNKRLQVRVGWVNWPEAGHPPTQVLLRRSSAYEELDDLERALADAQKVRCEELLGWPTKGCTICWRLARTGQNHVE